MADKKANTFHNEEHVKPFATLFDSFKIESKFNQSMQGKLAYYIIKDREEKQISSMFNSLMEIGTNFMETQTSAISCIAIAKSLEEAALLNFGMLKLTPNGIAVCPTCLDKAIMLAEENLTILKDIQEATKQYATNI